MTGSRWWQRARRAAVGEAGPGPAWALAAMSLLTMFIAVAAPRELATVSDQALHSALARLPALDTGITAQAGWQEDANGDDAMTPAAGQDMARRLTAAAGRVPVTVAGRWTSVYTIPQTIGNPAPRAVLTLAPSLAVLYRSDLAAYARVVTGRMPAAVTTVPPGPGVRHGAVRFDAAVTAATASRLGLRTGSVVNLGAFLQNKPAVQLRVTAILAPRQPGDPFWQADPTLAAPVIPLPPTGADAGPQYWQGGALVGPAELAALQRAYGGSLIHGEWFIPLARAGLTQATLPRVLASLRGLVATDGGSRLAARLPVSKDAFTSDTLTIGTGFPAAIGSFLAQQQTTAALAALLIADVLIAGLLVLLSCARLAATAYQPELALIRARGGSARQVAGRVLARSAGLAGPGAVAGAAAAVAVTPSPPGGTTAAALLGALAAVAAIGIPALTAGWAHRGIRPADAGRGDLVTERPSRRRLVAELTVLVIAGGALAAARLHGTGAGTDTFTQVAPVLAAAAAALVAVRLYPVPVRALLRLTAGRPGVVGFLALARAARARIGALLPALTLVISLTLAVFGTMVVGSVTASQAAVAWRQAGADVRVQAAGNNTVPAAAVRAVAAVPGVRRVAAVYAAAGGGALTATLQTGGGTARPVGLVVAQPSSYAALARETPWPAFPAGTLARPAGPVVPVLASAGLGTVGGRATMVLDGTRVTVRIAAATGPTAAMPAGGAFVVLPAWASARLPAVPGPDVLLATGAGISLPAVRAAIQHTVPGAQIRFRAQILAAMRNAPAPQAAARLYWLGTGVAALLSVVALLFGLALSERGRGQLIDRLTALGISSRQSRAVAVSEVLPLLAVAVLGTLVAGLVLAAVLGPALNLAVFTGAAGPVRVRPGLIAAVPAAAIVVLALVIVTVQSAASLRRNTAMALRQEEAG